VKDDQQRQPEHEPGLIEIRVTELTQIFNSIDPSPFREKDLAPEAEAFIVDWAREVHRDAPLTLLVHVEHPTIRPEEAAGLQEAVQEFFRQRATSTRRQLRRLFRVGRTSLLIGCVALGVSIVLVDLLVRLGDGARLGLVLRESLLIGGWVAMWRPLEIFLYDWWPIRAEARLFDRLATMPVQLAQASDQSHSATSHTRP
jgi:hypothetical protein